MRLIIESVVYVYRDRRRAALKWDVMDMMNMSYADGSFDVVLDKGALDAMASDDTDAVAQDVVKIFSEFARVLRVGGHYVCVSLAQDHVLAKLLHFFGSTGWAIEVHHIELEDLGMMMVDCSHLSQSAPTNIY